MKYPTTEYDYYLLQEITIVYPKVDDIDILFEDSYKDWKEVFYMSPKSDAKRYLKREVIMVEKRDEE